ncbi:Conserved oligomeric Golgi complex subunit 1 [Pseudozyma hubeiensis]|nr:Conserved oligomeric Golgi complex subunit 1 [Pseudozyma hubeiensis]
MSATSRRQPEAGGSTSADAGSAPTTPARPGRARHARTHASLTSSIASTSMDISAPLNGLPRRPSVPNEASRIFQTTGFDPFGTEPDSLFSSLTVKEVEAYERAVRSTAHGKAEELRSLVGQRYEDLLGTANTIIDMAGSSEQLSRRLHELSDGVRLAAVPRDNVESPKRSSRRKSFLPAQHLADESEVADASSLHREAIYVLGASLRLIMDTPEYVWKSIEKGKTLQASWTFLLARATWTDLVESASHSGSSASATGDNYSIDSVSEAVSLLKVSVKKAFPFIEKQWQTMTPMRKQIVHRAVLLLSDAQIESMAVADQLAALVLLDGTKFDQAFHLLLSQRLTAMRRMLQRTSPHQRDSGRSPAIPTKKQAAANSSDSKPDDNNQAAARAAETIAELVTLFARTLQHAVQVFVLPPKRENIASPSTPLLLDLLQSVTDPANVATATLAVESPISERSSLLSQPSIRGQSPASRQDAAALRAQRRRSSYGLPTTEDTVQAGAKAQSESGVQTDRSRPLRVSTASVVEALPSGRILARLLPPAFWAFAPHLDPEAKERHSPAHFLTELSSWSTKARETIIGSSESAGPATLRFLLSDLSDVSELALVRSSLGVALHRARRIVARKLAGSLSSTDERRRQATATIHCELDRLEESIDTTLQGRLLHLMERTLKDAAQDLLQETEKIVFALNSGTVSRVDSHSRIEAPLDALFHPIEADDRASLKEVANPSSSSRAYAATLQDDVCGRSKQIDRLVSMYEGPLATLSQQLQSYRAELGSDERFVGALASIDAKYDSALAASRAELETGFKKLLEQESSSSSERTGESVGRQSGASESTSLVMRMIAVLFIRTSSGNKIREPVKAVLERFWRPQLEQRISTTLKSGNPVNAKPQDTAKSSVSTSLLCALATLAESIVQLGPALAGPELAVQVRNILEGISNNKTMSASDSAQIRELLIADPTTLSKHIAADASLRRIRLALAPLVLALATTAVEPQTVGREAISAALTPAEPASAIGDVKPILSVSRKKMERFSSLPVR